MSYASDVYSDIEQMSQDPALLGDLSPAARATLGLVRFTVDQALQGKTPQQIAQDLADQAIGAGLQAGQQLLAQIAASVSPELGQLAGAVIPYVGWIVQMLLSAKPAGNQASVQSYTKGAQEVYEPIGQLGYSPGFGTGPGGQILPVDLFVRKELSPNKFGRRFQYTSMGRALCAITEYDGDMKAAHAKLGKGVGVPLARRMQFRTLRRRIVDSYNRLSDGGAALWTIYLDLLRHEFDCGHLTPTYARYLTVLDAGYNRWKGNADKDGSAGVTLETWEYNDLFAPVSIDLLKYGINHAQKMAVDENAGPWTFPMLFDSRARQQIYDTVQGWRQTLAPRYVQFQTLEEKVLAYMAAHKKPHIVLTLPSKKVKIAPQQMAAAAKGAANAAKLKAAVVKKAAEWTQAAGAQAAAPHLAMPAATIPVPAPTVPVPTVVHGLSFTPDTMRRAAGIGAAAPAAAAIAALLFL